MYSQIMNCHLESMAMMHRKYEDHAACAHFSNINIMSFPSQTFAETMLQIKC